MATETLVSTTANGTAVQSGPLNQADVDFYHEPLAETLEHY